MAREAADALQLPARADTRMQLRAALRALRQLIADPEDTSRVFEIIRAMSGPSQRRGLRRLKQTALGQRMLAERRVLLHTLQEREALAAMPTGTLGRAYYEFVYGEALSAEGLVAASMDGAASAHRSEDAELAWFSERMRDQHDLWHAVTGYGRDTLGEACLLAFTYAQIGNRGVGLIVLAAAWQLRRDYGLGAVRALWHAYRAGVHASWLAVQDWEGMLAWPVAEVRRLLATKPPAAYLALRTAAA